MMKRMIKRNTHSWGSWSTRPDSFQSEACDGALVPVTLGHVKDPGEFLIARFLDARIARQRAILREEIGPKFPRQVISYYFSIKTIPRYSK